MKSNTTETDSEIITTCMWYNSEISKNPLFFPDQFKKGIMVGDLMNTNGKNSKH